MSIAIPPGRTIYEQLQNKGITYKEFGSSMEMTEDEIKKLLNGELSITPDIAVRLEKVLSIPSKFWVNLEFIYTEKKIKETERRDRKGVLCKECAKKKHIESGYKRRKK